MTKEQANKFMNAQFDKFVSRVQNAQSDEEQIKFTDAAHKLYITLTQVDGFELENGNTSNLGS